MSLVLLLVTSVISFADFSPRVPTQVFNKLVLQADRFYYAPLKIEIELPSSHYLIIELPEGGGELDLASYLKENGVDFFKIRFKFDFPQEYQKSVRVFYIPRYKPISFAGLRFGAQCRKAYELSGHFKEGGRFSTKGLELSGALFRFLNTIGGDWYFAFESEGETYVSMVRVVDSRARLSLCEDN
jgi:hypothetical protein